MSLTLSWPYFASLSLLLGVHSLENSCSLCPDGGEMRLPQNVLSSIEFTCAEFEESFLSYLPPESCATIKETLTEGNVIDVYAFCGCDGVLAPNNCTFCDDSKTTFSRTSPWDNGGSEAPCADLALLAPFVINPDFCDNTIQFLAGFCCGFDNEDTCSVCPDGSKMRHPNRPLLQGEGAGSCASLNDGIGSLSRQECEYFHETIGPVDLTSYCGCEGSSVPNKCSLCGDGLVLVNEHMDIPDAKGFTCKSMDGLARHVVDDVFCETQFSMLPGECCGVPASPSTDPPMNGPRLPEASAAAVSYPILLLSVFLALRTLLN